MSYLLKAFADLRQKACKNPLCILIARDSRAFVSISGAVSGQFFYIGPEIRILFAISLHAEVSGHFQEEILCWYQG